jgi:hypothetical protein
MRRGPFFATIFVVQIARKGMHSESYGCRGKSPEAGNSGARPWERTVEEEDVEEKPFCRDAGSSGGDPSGRGMLALMTLVVKVGPAAATPEQMIAFTEVGTSDTAKNGSSDIVLWIRSSNGYRQG